MVAKNLHRRHPASVEKRASVELDAPPYGGEQRQLVSPTLMGRCVRWTGHPSIARQPTGLDEERVS
jgi:hypothetical protein